MLQDSWIKLLYDEPSEVDQNVALLRRKLNVGLSSKRSHEKGDLLPYVGLAVCLREYFAFCDTQRMLFIYVYIVYIVKSYAVFSWRVIFQVFLHSAQRVKQYKVYSIIFKEKAVNLLSFVRIKLYHTHLFFISRFYS